MKKHNNHEAENPLQALHDTIRNKFTPEVKRIFNEIQKETNPYKIVKLIDEIQFACHRAKEQIQIKTI